MYICSYVDMQLCSYVCVIQVTAKAVCTYVSSIVLYGKIIKSSGIAVGIQSHSLTVQNPDLVSRPSTMTGVND